MWEYHTHYDSGNTPHCCLSDFRENKVSRIYLPKIHTKLPLCLERLVSCIHCIGRILPPKETVSTLVDQIIHLGCSSLHLTTAPPPYIRYLYNDELLFFLIFGCFVAPFNYFNMVRAGGLEPPRLHCRWIFVLLYVTIAVLLRCSLEHVFTLFIQTQVVGVCSLHIYSLKLCFSHDKFQLMHDNLDINNANFQFHYQYYFHQCDLILMQ